MARALRVQFEDAPYHLCARGNRRLGSAESGGQITRPIKPEALKSVALNLWIIETVKQCCSVAKIQCGSALRSLAARTH